MAKSSIDIYEKLHDYENAEEMSQMLGGGGGGGANQDRVANEYEHDPAFGPLPIFFYPNQFTKYSQLLTATDPLSVALLTATLTIGDVEFYEATILFILFNFTILFGRHLILLELDLTSYVRKKLYCGSSFKALLKVSFTHGNGARIRDLTILTLFGIGGRLLYLSYTSSLGTTNWRFYNMFLVSCIALLLSFFQLYAYIYCLWCVKIPQETERRLMPHKQRHHPARLQVGTVLLERKYSRTLCEELAQKHNVHIIWMKQNLFKPNKQIKNPHESIYNTQSIPFSNPFPLHKHIN